MTFIDRGDDEFQRALLRSASDDMPDADASERAWSRFAALMTGVATSLREPGHVRAPSGAARPVGRFASTVTVMKWFVAGSIGGSAVTFALVGRHAVALAPPASIAPTATQSPPVTVASSLAPAASSGWVASEAQPSPSVALASSTSRAPGHALARRDGQVTEEPGSPKPRASAPPDEGLSLAAEVAALDAARRALDAGTPDDALTLVHHYLHAFPKGKLVPEAEVLGIEALAAKGDRARITKEATRFLERYPNAPQRTRVEQLRAEVEQK